MPTLIKKLNQAFKVLTGKDGSTTQAGVDPEYLDSSLADITTVDNSRIKKYSDYIAMDDNYGGEISSTLDAVADLVLRIDEPVNDIIKVMSDSESTTNFIKDLYYYLDLKSLLWSWARSTTKFGDMFVEIIWFKDNQNSKLSNIGGLRVLPAKTIFLNVENGVVNQTFPYRQEIDGSQVAEFRPWQLIHFMLPREPTDDYGTSWLKAARLSYRQLVAMENALVVGRLKKPNVRVHRIDVTGKTGDQAVKEIQRYKDQFLKKLWVNPSTGKLEKHQNPMMSNDDIYMAVTKEGGKFAGMDLIEGKSEIDIKDILYIREKMMAALKTPKHRININDVGVSNKLVAIDQGLNFSASIHRVQLMLVQGIRFITDLALIVKGVDINSRKNDYTLMLPKQRTTDELIAARVELIKSTVAKNYRELDLLSDEFIMSKILNLEADQIAKIKKQIVKSNAQNGDGKAGGKDKEGNDKDKKFNKTGMGSAPVRKPQKESLAKVFEDKEVKVLIDDVSELMRNKRVFGNKNFGDMDYIKKELAKKQ
jgi:hypothetical protein